MSNTTQTHTHEPQDLDAPHEECYVCCKKVPFYQMTELDVFSPFEKAPLCTLKVCEACNEMGEPDDLMYCNTCCRRVFYNNGYRINIRLRDSEIICVACLQKIWKAKGMNTDLADKLTADWFNKAELENEGFTIKYDHQVVNSRTKDAFEEKITPLLDDYLVIVNLYLQGVGGLSHVNVWIKPKEETK